MIIWNDLMRHLPAEYYICDGCGGKSIQSSAYVDSNTGEIIEYMYNCAAYCTDCDSDIDLVTKEEFMENLLLK